MINMFEVYYFEEFSTKSITWVNNDKSPPHPRAKLLNITWSMKLFPSNKLFAWGLIRENFKENKLRKIWLNINGESRLCRKDNEDINHLFIQCEMAKNI